MPRNTAVPASYIILRRDDKILLLSRQGSGYFDGWYSLPAGHVEFGELPLACAIREAKEEINIDIESAALSLVHTMYRAKKDETGERVDYFFVASSWNGEPTIVEPDKCDDLQWFSLNALPENIIPFVRHALEAIERGVFYSEEF